MSEINKKVLMDYIKNRKSELEQACKNHTGHHKRHLTGQHSALVDIEHMIEEGILDVPENPSLITTIESQKEEISELEMEMVLTERVVTKKEEMLKDVENRMSEVIDSRDKALDEVESQKEEIDKLQSQLEWQVEKTSQNLCIAEAFEKDIESLKAITELAVKGLKEVQSYEIQWFEDTHLAMVKISSSTLSEIERLQNG